MEICVDNVQNASWFSRHWWCCDLIVMKVSNRHSNISTFFLTNIHNKWNVKLLLYRIFKKPSRRKNMPRGEPIGKQRRWTRKASKQTKQKKQTYTNKEWMKNRGFKRKCLNGKFQLYTWKRQYCWLNRWIFWGTCTRILISHQQIIHWLWHYLKWRWCMQRMLSLRVPRNTPVIDNFVELSITSIVLVVVVAHSQSVTHNRTKCNDKKKCTKDILFSLQYQTECSFDGNTKDHLTWQALFFNQTLHW